MEQRLSLVTLGVADVERARRFYERLGWRGSTVEGTVFYAAGPLVLVLWGREQLARDCGLPPPSPGAVPTIALAHNVRTPGKVDEVLAAAADAGARITQPARVTFYGGYAGVFTDPDGHPWEIAHNPGFGLTADGAVVLPDFG